MRPVMISSGAFWFCRISVAVFLWVGFALKAAWLVHLSTAILLASCVLGVNRAPLIVLYSGLEKLLLKRPPGTMVDINAMRFAHALGSGFALLCSLLLVFHFRYAWGVVLLFALIKSISAAGFCPAEKLFACVGGQCCVGRKKC